MFSFYIISSLFFYLFFFFFNDTATTEIYTLSLHDALPIYAQALDARMRIKIEPAGHAGKIASVGPDRKSTRLNSSHGYISYAVFCLKKKKKKIKYSNVIINFRNHI